MAGEETAMENPGVGKWLTCPENGKKIVVAGMYIA